MWEILTKEEILRIWILSGGSKTRLSRAISLLLGQKKIESVAQGLYIIQNPIGKGVIQEQYWKIIEKLIAFHTPAGAIIWGDKALEFHLQNYWIPDTLLLYTRDTTKRVRLSDGREVHFRVLFSWEKTGKRNLFRLLTEGSKVISTEQMIPYLALESALLDALSLRRHDTGVEEVNILRFLRNFHKHLSRDILGNLVKYRYIRAINRLRVLTRDNGYDELYKKTLDIIRDEGGGCYVNV